VCLSPTVIAVRRLLTALGAAAVIGVAVVAVVDALRGSPSARPQSSTPPPPCERDQLALSIEAQGGESAVVLRQVRGRACRLTSLKVRIFVIDRRGRRNEIALGETPDPEASELGGDYPPGLANVIPVSICGEGAPFVVEARAGQSSTRGPGPIGGQNCAAAVRSRVLRFGSGSGVRHTTIEALDPRQHPVTVRIVLPRSADVDVWMETTSGSRIDVLDRSRRSDCKRHDSRDICVIRYGLLEARSPGVWTLFIRKLSRSPTLIRVSVAFEDSFGQG
jgi:hypothetical protein